MKLAVDTAAQILLPLFARDCESITSNLFLLFRFYFTQEFLVSKHFRFTVFVLFIFKQSFEERLIALKSYRTKCFNPVKVLSSGKEHRINNYTALTVINLLIS